MHRRSPPSSRRCRPVSVTNTSSRLACRVVSRASVEPAGPAAGRAGPAARRAARDRQADRPPPPRGAACTAGRPAQCVRRAGRPAPSREGELDDVLAAEPGDQLGRRAQGDHLAVIDDRHPVAQPLGLVHVVRRQQDGPALGAEAADDVPELPARLRVEAGRRLVEEQQLRVADQGAGHRQPLLLAAGELARRRRRPSPPARPGRSPRRASSPRR